MLKYILTFFLIIFIVSPLEAKVPKQFKGSKVYRKLKNGKLQKFDGNKYMIVKRGVKRPSRKNKIKAYLGYGAHGYDVTLAEKNTVVRDDFKPLIGVGYERRLSPEYSVEVIGTTNETLLLGVGYSF